MFRKIDKYFTDNSIDLEDKYLDEMEILHGFFTHLSSTVEEIKEEERKKGETLNEKYTSLSQKNTALTSSMDSVAPSFRYPIL